MRPPAHGSGFHALALTSGPDAMSHWPALSAGEKGARVIPWDTPVPAETSQ